MLAGIEAETRLRSAVGVSAKCARIVPLNRCVFKTFEELIITRVSHRADRIS